MATERELVIANKDVNRFSYGDILAVISEMPNAYLVAPVADAIVRLEPNYQVINKTDCLKLIGVKIVHALDILDRTIKTEIRKSDKLDDDMNVECSKCGRRYCDCESKY